MHSQDYVTGLSAGSDSDLMHTGQNLNHTMSMTSLQSLGSSNSAHGHSNLSHSFLGSSNTHWEHRSKKMIRLGYSKGDFKSVWRWRQPTDDSNYDIPIHKIISGEENKRTSLMIKNIPNKYNKKMLLVYIDKNHKGKYDFFYLPIDYKNHCNVGYAFINFIHPAYILDFYYEFNGEKWPAYKSEKICEIKYGWLQGKKALKSHFKETKVYKNHNKKINPVIYDIDTVDQEEIEAIYDRYRNKQQKEKKSEAKSNTQELTSKLKPLINS